MFIFLINLVLYLVLKVYKFKIKIILVFENFKIWLVVDYLSILIGVVGGKVFVLWNYFFFFVFIVGFNYDVFYMICFLECFVLLK